LVGVFVGFGYRWPWTGFGQTSYSKPNGDLEVQPKKTLWDWLQLLGTLAIPVVLATAGLWFTAQQDQTQRGIEEQRAQDAALQTYLNQMSTLLLEHDLSNPEENYSTKQTLTARSVARARTLTVLQRLDGHRKYSIILFLGESRLIQEEGDAPVGGIVPLVGADLSDLNVETRSNLGWDLSMIYLHGTDLSDAKLHKVVLRDATLSNTDLSGADLSEADLTGATLSDAILTNANLKDAQGITQEQLEEAKSLKGATMPDGQKYED
jgi:hypothetical protein